MEAAQKGGQLLLFISLTTTLEAFSYVSNPVLMLFSGLDGAAIGFGNNFTSILTYLDFHVLLLQYGFRVLRLYLGLDFAFLYLLIGSCLGFFMNFLSFCFVLSIDHSPWNGCMLADFVTPFFLFIVEVAFALTLKVQLFTNHLIIIIIIPKNKPTNR